MKKGKSCFYFSSLAVMLFVSLLVTGGLPSNTANAEQSLQAHQVHLNYDPDEQGDIDHTDPIDEDVLPEQASENADKHAEDNQAVSTDLVNLQLLAITDLHGYLKPEDNANNKNLWSPKGNIIVGGAAYMATHIKQLQAGHQNSMVVADGDNFSGWPFEVESYQNEPTIEFLNKIGVEFSSVGNHELDQSKDFLVKHMEKGICFGTRDVDSCFKDSTGTQFHGSDFPFISANVRDVHSGQLITQPYFIKQISDGHGGTIPVGFIGLTVFGAESGTTSFQEGDLIHGPAGGVGQQVCQGTAGPRCADNRCARS